MDPRWFAGPLLVVLLSGCSSTDFVAGAVELGLATTPDTDPGPDPDPDPGTDPIPDEDPPPAVDLPSAWSWTGNHDPGEPVSIDVVGVAIDIAVDEAFGYHPAPVFTAYDIAMASARSDCPGVDDSGSVQFWIDTCETPEGAFFDGYAQKTEYADSASFEGTTYFASATITTPTGATFVSAAHLTDVRIGGIDEDRRSYTNWVAVVSGTNSWDGPGVNGTWLADGLLPTVTLNFTAYTDGARMGSVSGVVAIPGDTFVGVAYDAEVWNAASGAACTEEPAGAVMLRDPDGDWYEARFDGGYDATDTAACDGCGTVWWRGQALGEVCPDFSAWLEWGAEPW